MVSQLNKFQSAFPAPHLLGHEARTATPGSVIPSLEPEGWYANYETAKADRRGRGVSGFCQIITVNY